MKAKKPIVKRHKDDSVSIRLSQIEAGWLRAQLDRVCAPFDKAPVRHGLAPLRDVLNAESLPEYDREYGRKRA